MSVPGPSSAAKKGAKEEEDPRSYQLAPDVLLEYEKNSRAKLAKCLAAIKIGVSPPASSVECSVSTTAKLQLVWDTIVRKCHTKVELSAPAKCMSAAAITDAGWRLSVTLLDTLVQMMPCIETLEMLPAVKKAGIEVLSVKDLIDVQQAITIITALGLAHNLPPGIGIQCETALRFDFGPIIVESLSDCHKFVRMGYILEELNLLCKHNYFAQRIFGRPLIHFLAASIHMCYSPITNPRKKSREMPRQLPLSLKEYDALIATQKNLRKMFETNIIPKIQKSSLIKCIFPLSSDAAPKWYRKKCKEMAMEIFLAKDGLKAMARGLKDMFNEAIAEIIHIMRNLIQTAVESESDKDKKEGVIANLCQQACDLIKLGALEYKSKASFWTQIGVYCGLALIDLDIHYARAIIWNHVFNPIFILTSNQYDLVEQQVSAVDEIEFAMYLADLLLTYRSPSTGTQDHINLFQPVWHGLFKIFVCFNTFLNQQVKEVGFEEEISPLHLKLELMLAKYLEISHCRNTPPVSEICLSLLIWEEAGVCVPIRLNLSLGTDPSKPKQILMGREELDDDDRTMNWYAIVNVDCKCLFNSVMNKNERSQSVLASVFTQLIEYEYTHNTASLKLNDVEVIGEDGTRQLQQSLDLYNPAHLKKFGSLVLLAEYGNNNVGGDITSAMCGDQTKDTLIWALRVLRGIVGQMEDAVRNGQSFEYPDTLASALQIVLAFTDLIMNQHIMGLIGEGSDLQSFTWNDLAPFLPFLKKIVASKQVSQLPNSTKTLAEDLVIRIQTKGKGLTPPPTPVAPRERNRNPFTPYDQGYKDVDECMEYLKIATLPYMKGHFLLRLGDFIECRDKRVFERLEEIRAIVMEELKNPDTYVYSMAINVLVVLGCEYHASTMPTLMDEYVKGMNHDDPDKVDYQRLLIGQGIMGIIRGLGEVSQIYGQPLLKVLQEVMKKATEVELKESALSIIAELTSIMKYSLGAVIAQIWGTIEPIMKYEKEVEVRRAAVYCLSRCLRALCGYVTKEYLMTDPDIAPHLRDARRGLQLLRQREQDVTCIIHIQHCMDDMSEIGKILLTPDPNFEFKLRILR